MLDYPASPLRPWRQIAAELCRETDTRRVLELSKELDEALEVQTSIYKSASAKPAQADQPMGKKTA
jgi:hypothetical protein